MSDKVHVVPVDGGLAVGVDAVVEVPAEVGAELVVSGPFKPVRATTRATAKSTGKRKS